MAANNTSFSEKEYLEFLASHASSNWLNELTIDGGVELKLDPVLEGSDLVDPLKTFAFPAERLENLDDVLSSALIGYSLELEEGECIDEFKIMYAASLYLYCHITTAKTTGVANLACALIAHCAIHLPMEEKLHVLRFLLWIFENEEAKRQYRLDYPKASLLLCAYIVAVNPKEALLQKANAIFRAEVAAVGPPPDKTAMQAILEEAGKIDPTFDAKVALEQIGAASPCHEISVKIFRGVLQEAKLDVTQVAMLKPGIG